MGVWASAGCGTTGAAGGGGASCCSHGGGMKSRNGALSNSKRESLVDGGGVGSMVASGNGSAVLGVGGPWTSWW